MNVPPTVDNIAARCHRCKRIVYIAINEPSVIDANEKKTIAQMVVAGLSIEHMTMEQFRKEGFGHGQPCTDKKPFILTSEATT